MVRFFDLSGLYDKSWFQFILITILSATVGDNFIFRQLQIPVITGYMIIGFMCGPYVLDLMSIAQTEELAYVSHAALSFIAFSAGAELYLPEIMPLVKPILWISFFIISFTMFVGSLITFGVGGTVLLPWMDGYNSCNFSVSMLIAIVLAAGSPTAMLAIVRELQARGPVTSVMIGITVAGDVFIITIFAIIMSITKNMCSGDSFDGATFAINLVMIPTSIVWGYILGLGMIAMLAYDKTVHLILPIGFFNYLICDFIEAASTQDSDFEISVDPLLICITAGYLVGNSQHREEVEVYLKSMSKYIFIPFFTAVGLQLNLPVLILALGFSIVASLVRAFCMALGTTAGGRMTGMKQEHATRLWLGLLPQAGVSLGLAAIVGHTFETTFGRDFQSTMLGIILVNQIIGPLGTKYLIKYCHEDGQGDAGQHDFKRITAAAHDGHLEAHVMVAADTQTEDLFYSILEAGNKDALAALTQPAALSGQDEECGIEMNPIHQSTGTGTGTDTENHQNGHSNGNGASNGEGAGDSVSNSHCGSHGGDSSGNAGAVAGAGRVKVLTPRVRRGSINSGYMRVNDDGEEEENVGKPLPLPFDVDKVVRFFKL